MGAERRVHSEEEKQQGEDVVVKFVLANKQKLLDKGSLKIDVPESIVSSYLWKFDVADRLAEAGLDVKIQHITGKPRALVELVR